MNKYIKEKLTNTRNFIKNYQFRILFFAGFYIIVAFTSTDGWNFGILLPYFLLCYILKLVIKSMPQKLNIDNFLPSKPERDGIRYLRGRRAKEFEIAWENTDTYLIIGRFRQFLLEIRLFIINLTGLPKDYFSERHRYDLRSRRALDRFALTNYELRIKHKPDAYYSRWRRLFFKYLKFRYRKEEKRFEYWIRTTSHRKRPVYFWYEDTEKYEKKYNIHKRTDDEQNEIERRMIA